MGLKISRAETISGIVTTGHCFTNKSNGKRIILFDDAGMVIARDHGYGFDGDYVKPGTEKEL